MVEHILLLHGAIGSKKQLEKLKGILSKQFNVFDLNFDGHGGTPFTADFSIDLFTTNVIDFLQDQKIEAIHIFGYSMGGYVALNLAKHHPEVVKKIVTLATKIDWTPEFSAQEIRMLNPAKIAEKVPKFAAVLQKTHHDQWEEVLNQTAKMMFDLGYEPPLSETDFVQIKQETLVTVGDQDKMVTAEESQKLSRSLPNGEFRIMEGFQHPIERVDIEQLASTITDFIKINK